ncbi:MAG: RAD55 family ATPase [Planctomycetota bacterium]
MFDTFKTGIDGLDSILGGGIRYPNDSSCFVFITGGAGTGKTLLALEMLTRAWLRAADGATLLYYSVEHSPQTLHAKLAADFDFYGSDAEIEVLPQEVAHKVCLEARSRDRRTRLVITQADTAGIDDPKAPSFRVDVDWILAEIGNYHLGGNVEMVCIDNVGLLLTDLDYFGKRSKLLETRRALISKQIHGIFVHEEDRVRDLRLPSAEEFSTDLLIELSFEKEVGNFKARHLEILKARHQYYYRGAHQFSIAGHGAQRDYYLGARNERGPGVHIYPSVAAQLSIARDRAGFAVPKRGDAGIDMGHPDVNAAFGEGLQPPEGSSTVLLAEPGTRYTYLALRCLTAERSPDSRTLMVATKEDRDALQRICVDEPALRPHALDDSERFDRRFRVLYLHPEYITEGKFTWDIMQVVMASYGQEHEDPVRRMAFDNIYRLKDRFPLIRDPHFMVRALLDLLRYRGVTPLFVDLVRTGAAQSGSNFDPAPFMTTFDNVIHLYLEDVKGKPTPRARVLKSTAREFLRSPVNLDYERK